MIWKLHFWGFPEMFCHQKKVVDHKSGQAKLLFFKKLKKIENFIKYFLSWDDIFAVRNLMSRKYSVWKPHFWRFPESPSRSSCHPDVEAQMFNIIKSNKTTQTNPIHDPISRSYLRVDYVFWVVVLKCEDVDNAFQTKHTRKTGYDILQS